MPDLRNKKEPRQQGNAYGRTTGTTSQRQSSSFTNQSGSRASRSGQNSLPSRSSQAKYDSDFPNVTTGREEWNRKALDTGLRREAEENTLRAKARRTTLSHPGYRMEDDGGIMHDLTRDEKNRRGYTDEGRDALRRSKNARSDMEERFERRETRLANVRAKRDAMSPESRQELDAAGARREVGYRRWRKLKREHGVDGAIRAAREGSSSFSQNNANRQAREVIDQEDIAKSRQFRRRRIDRSDAAEDVENAAEWDAERAATSFKTRGNLTRGWDKDAADDQYGRYERDRNDSWDLKERSLSNRAVRDEDAAANQFGRRRIDRTDAARDVENAAKWDAERAATSFETRGNLARGWDKDAAGDAFNQGRIDRDDLAKHREEAAERDFGRDQRSRNAAKLRREQSSSSRERLEMDDTARGVDDWNHMYGEGPDKFVNATPSQRNAAAFANRSGLDEDSTLEDFVQQGVDAYEPDSSPGDKHALGSNLLLLMNAHNAKNKEFSEDSHLFGDNTKNKHSAWMREGLALNIDDEEAVADWVDRLGTPEGHSTGKGYPQRDQTPLRGGYGGVGGEARPSSFDMSERPPPSRLWGD